MAAEHIALAIGPRARLPFGEGLLVTTAQMVGLIVRNDGCMDTTSVVRFFELEEVRVQTVLLSLKCCHIGSKHGPQIGPEHPVQRETLSPIVLTNMS
jgi:hypothetical protein